MSKCREEFDALYPQFSDDFKVEDVLPIWQAAWNTRGKVDYQHADANYADEFVLKAIEQEDEK